MMFSKLIAIAIAAMLGVTVHAFAQSSPTQLQKRSAPVRSATPTTKPQGISAKDKQAILSLFQGVDKSKYRLQFNDGKQQYGSKNVRMQDIQQVQRYTNPAVTAGWIVFVVEGDDVIYVLAVGNSQLESVLGKQKAAQLHNIMAKYGR